MFHVVGDRGLDLLFSSMERLAPAARWVALRVRIEHGEFLTRSRFAQARRLGIVNVQTLHTTTAIVVNEGEPLLMADFAALLQKVAPCDVAYRHDDLQARAVNLTADERVNGHSHCRALLLAPSACLNVVDGHLLLGRWQRVFLAELDGPRARDVSVLIIGEPRR